MNSTADPVASRKIVVGVDGSANSIASLGWATALAAGTGATVEAIIAWNYPVAALMPVVGAPVPPAEHLANAKDAILSAIVDEIETGDVNIEQTVTMGAARSVLTEASAEHELLVIGRTGNSRLKQVFLGSTVSHCVRHSECPVVVVRDSIVPERAITVAVDGSAASINALAWALGLGDDHEVVAIYSHDEWELDELSFDDEFRKELDNRADEMLSTAVATAVERTGADANRVKRQVVAGDPRTTLVDQADRSALLVLGAQGHSGIARWMLGSLADYAVNHAPGTVAIWR